jgi:hypothetical protein
MKTIRLQRTWHNEPTGRRPEYTLKVPIKTVRNLKLGAKDVFEVKNMPGSEGHPEPCILFIRMQKVKA